MSVSSAVRVERFPREQGQRPWAAIALTVGAAMALVLAGSVDVARTSGTMGACVARVGCEQIGGAGAAGFGSIGSSFAVVSAQGASAVWFEGMVGPASPALRHFLHPAEVGRSAFEPISPALEHFLHPLPSRAFELVSPALEHFLHPAP